MIINLIPNTDESIIFDSIEDIENFMRKENIISDDIDYKINVVPNPTELGSGGMVFLSIPEDKPSPFSIDGAPIYYVLIAEFEEN